MRRRCTRCTKDGRGVRGHWGRGVGCTTRGHTHIRVRRITPKSEPFFHRARVILGSGRIGGSVLRVVGGGAGGRRRCSGHRVHQRLPRRHDPIIHRVQPRPVPRGRTLVPMKHIGEDQCHNRQQKHRPRHPNQFQHNGNVHRQPNQRIEVFIAGLAGHWEGIE